MYELFIALLIIVIVILYFRKIRVEKFYVPSDWDLSDKYIPRKCNYNCKKLPLNPDKNCDKKCQCKAIDSALRVGAWNNEYDPVYAYNIWKKAYSECSN